MVPYQLASQKPADLDPNCFQSRIYLDFNREKPADLDPNCFQSRINLGFNGLAL